MPPFVRAPSADFTNVSGNLVLTNFTNVQFSATGVFTGQTNGTDYRAVECGFGGPIITPAASAVATPVLSSTFALGTTPTLPAGTQAGDLIILIPITDGATVTTLPGGIWTNRTILGAGAGGNAKQAAFRILERVWVDGDTLPVLATPNAVLALRVNPAYRIFRDTTGVNLNGSVFGLGTNDSVTPATEGIILPAMRNDLAIGSYDLILTNSRNAAGTQPLLDFAPQGYTQVANTETAGESVTRRNVWIEGPTTALGDLGLTVQAPVPFQGSNGGGGLRIVFEPV